MSELSIVIKPRDLDILRSLLESRILTLDHIAAFHFAGSYEAAKQRIRKLKIAGLIAERQRLVNEPSIHFLTRKALLVLKTEGVLHHYPALSIPSLLKRSQVSEAKIRHELEVLDTKASILSALRKTPHLSIETFSTWPMMNEFRASPARHELPRPILPDGYLQIREEKNGHEFVFRYFLELDRSSETHEVLAEKCAGYVEYYRSGDFAVRHGGKKTDARLFPFRVLIVLKNAERRNNTAERLLQNNPPILRQAYLATFAEVRSDPFGPIWIRPIDYRNAVAGTEFDLNPRPHRTVYKHQVQREKLVESKIQKKRMLEDEAES